MASFEHATPDSRRWRRYLGNVKDGEEKEDGGRRVRGVGGWRTHGIDIRLRQPVKNQRCGIGDEIRKHKLDSASLDNQLCHVSHLCR
jgi:hypothetical protein